MTPAVSTVAVALVGPPSAVVAGLVILATRVGSRADDPEEIETRLVEGPGASTAECDDRIGRRDGADSNE